jgi:Domain of unknown function (DUF397)
MGAGDWRTASYSNPGGNCTEVGTVTAGVLVRDTKQAGLPARVELRFTAAAWSRFTSQVKSSGG